MNVITRNLQEDLDLVAYWLKCNRLSLNTDKTKIMCFSTQYYRRDTSINIHINNTQLEQVMSYKYLGLILDYRLNFMEHVSRIITKGRQRIGCIGRARKFITAGTALTLNKSMVLPLMDFGDIIFANAPQDSLARLEVVQNNACRIILRQNKYAHVAEMLNGFTIIIC